MAISLTDVTNGLNPATNPIFSRIILAVFILLLGFIAGRILGLFVRRFLSDISFDKHARKLKIKLPLEKFIGNLVSFIAYIFTIYWSLNTLGITSTILTILSFGILFVIIISFLLAIKDFFPNVFSGLRIKWKDMFNVGDEIRIKEVRGTILETGLFDTKIRTQYDDVIIIPNAIFTKRQILVKKKNK